MMDRIIGYLQRYGWQYEEAEDILVTSFATDDGQTYPFLILKKDEIYSFQAQFKRKTGASPTDCAPYLLALRMNYAWPFLKIGLNDSMDEFVISLDLFLEACTYSVFSNSLETFSDGLVVFSETMQEWVLTGPE
jgi:hypothetical protein